MSTSVPQYNHVIDCMATPVEVLLSGSIQSIPPVHTWQFQALRCGNADALCPTIQPFKLAHVTAPKGRAFGGCLLLFLIGLGGETLELRPCCLQIWD